MPHQKASASSDYTIACYYFPNYHVDPKNEAVHGPGWSEWELVKRRLDQHADAPNILTVNAWNEWTEGSYLEPDTAYGVQYLEAIRAVFG
jgi:hypothetical protein